MWSLLQAVEPRILRKVRYKLHFSFTKGINGPARRYMHLLWLNAVLERHHHPFGRPDPEGAKDIAKINEMLVAWRSAL